MAGDPQRREAPRAQTYPQYVITAEERRRWDLAEGIAREMFGDVDEASVWLAARSIYKMPVETGE